MCCDLFVLVHESVGLLRLTFSDVTEFKAGDEILTGIVGGNRRRSEADDGKAFIATLMLRSSYMTQASQPTNTLLAYSSLRDVSESASMVASKVSFFFSGNV